MGNIEDLMPDAVEQTTLPRHAGRANKALFTVIVLVAVCVMFVFAGWFAVKAFIWPTQETSTGTCAVYDRDSCVDLKLSFLAGVGRLDLPENSEVLDSGTSKFLFTGSEWGSCGCRRLRSHLSFRLCLPECSTSTEWSSTSRDSVLYPLTA